MGYSYRCNKCRTRNTFAKKIEEYVGPKKCKNCRHTRFYWDRERNQRTDYCTCEGYHFPHRKKSPFCIHNPDYEFNVRTLRYGEDPLDVRIDQAWDAPITTPEGVPF